MLSKRFPFGIYYEVEGVCGEKINEVRNIKDSLRSITVKEDDSMGLVTRFSICRWSDSASYLAQTQDENSLGQI
jgi:hypothetical protein